MRAAAAAAGGSLDAVLPGVDEREFHINETSRTMPVRAAPARSLSSNAPSRIIRRTFLPLIMAVEKRRAEEMMNNGTSAGPQMKIPGGSETKFVSNARRGH